MFITRLLSGMVLVIIAFFAFHFGGYPLAAVLLLLSLGGFTELLKALKVKPEKGFNSITILGYAAIIAYYSVMALTADTTYMVMVAVFTVILFLMLYVFTFPKYKVEDIMSGIFAYFYAPVMLSFGYLTRNLENGRYIVWMILIASWGFDTCAYCVGMLTGKTIGNHKFLPRLSPKKSIEGVIGGIIGAGLIAFIYGSFVMPEEKWLLTVIAALGGIIAQIGDLAASAIKRNKDIKDYGKVIPGHGGVMDRFDSCIFTAPIIYYLALFGMQLLK